MLVLVGGAALLAVAAIAMLRPSWLEQLPVALVWPLAAAAALALLVSDAAPTGWVLLDGLVRAGAGAGAVLAASRLELRWTLWLAAVTTFGLVAADAGSWETAGAAGAGLALGLLLTGGGRRPVLQAAAAALLVAPLGHLDWPLAAGASALLAVVALLPLLLAGLRHAPPRLRTVVRVGVGAYLLLCVAGAVVGGLSALSARADVDRAVDQVVDGLDEADADDPAPAIAELREAAASFEQAESNLRAWWARPALLVPVVSQHSRTVATMADSGADLATAAADSLEEVDLDALHPVDGRIDLDLVAQVEPPLDRALTSLQRADDRLEGVQSPLLLGLVADRLDKMATEVGRARKAAETASAALDVAPDVLGADRPRHYFLAMQTPSELRGAGGFMGSWGELVIDKGQIDLVRTGPVRELTQGGEDPAGREIEGQPEFVDHWGPGAGQYWGLIGFTPDFPTVGAIIEQLYPQSGGTEIDGVISLDPASFAAMLELTGPVTVDGYEGELRTETAEQVLLHDQYLANADEGDREAFLEEAIQVLFDELTSGELPGPQSISGALSPMVEGRHIQLYSSHDAEQRFFESIGADGSVATDDDVTSIGMVGQNYNGNKIDYFLRRHLTYDVTWDPATGAIEGTVDVELENQAPASGLPESIIGWGGDPGLDLIPVADGENLQYLSLYSDMELSDLTLDGEPAELHSVAEDLGHLSYDLYVRIPSGSTSRVQGKVSGVTEAGERLRLDVLRQATATPDGYTIRVHLPDGWRFQDAEGVEPDGTLVLETDSTRPVDLSLLAERANAGVLGRLQGH